MSRPEELLRDVTRSQYFAVLNTLSQSLPYSSLISFAIGGDLRSLVFVTGRNTRKYANIQQNPNVSILIDNRTNQPSDVAGAVAVTAIGTAREEREGRNAWRDLFLARHPQLERFIDASDNAIMLVTVREYIIAGFDETQRVAMPE
jgi:nitroimidazol reductase NimA-like FMN-containing flavoprotein (pyridoxamine 5'-phosphate oxidase superfamily)